MKATDYLKKFSLNGKLAFVVGGLGLIGSEISIALSSAGAKTIILDLDSEKAKKLKKEMREPFYKIYYRKLDCVDMERHEENFKTLINEFGCPNVFINCSYFIEQPEPFADRSRWGRIHEGEG